MNDDYGDLEVMHMRGVQGRYQCTFGRQKGSRLE